LAGEGDGEGEGDGVGDLGGGGDWDADGEGDDDGAWQLPMMSVRSTYGLEDDSLCQVPLGDVQSCVQLMAGFTS
jgi:hypothetical protein